MNTREMIREAARELREAGVPDPEYDSAALLSRVTGLPPLVLRIGAEKEPTTEQTEAFREMIRRRKDREPLQYIEGDAEFMGIRLEVDDRVLIPRQDTETLCLEALRLLKGMGLSVRQIERLTGINRNTIQRA
jgi:release factor glutamine methyltransferase